MTTPAVHPRAQAVVVETPAFRIRAKHADDFADDYAWRTDEETARFDGNRPLNMSFADYVRIVEQDVLFGDPFRRSFSVDSAEGVHIGNIMVYNIGSGRETAELGLSIGREADRGLGIGAAVTVEFVRWVWETQPFRRIYLHTLDWNDRARRCFARAGFDDVGLVQRGELTFTRMETRREWWLMWEAEGRFEAVRQRVRAPEPPVIAES